MEGLKPCPNCGLVDIEAEGSTPDSIVFCRDCGEEQILEEWQADSARERMLNTRIRELEAVVEAAKVMMDEWYRGEDGYMGSIPIAEGLSEALQRAGYGKWGCEGGSYA